MTALDLAFISFPPHGQSALLLCPGLDRSLRHPGRLTNRQIVLCEWDLPLLEYDPKAGVNQLKPVMSTCFLIPNLNSSLPRPRVTRIEETLSSPAG